MRTSSLLGGAGFFMGHDLFLAGYLNSNIQYLAAEKMRVPLPNW